VIVSQFCGIGTTFAIHDLGLTDVGIDIEPTVELTRKSLGWTDTICADITDLDPADFAGAEGLTSSPPCQSWSRAGKGLGLDDPRGQLVWQPLVWALAIRPRFVMCEQVPEARGAFELIAHRLREVGYHATVYTVSAETLGVPQTRLRVFLAAHRDRVPDRPRLTHQRYRKGRPRVEPMDMLGHLPWVSMTEALGRGCHDGWELRYRRGAGMVERYGERPGRTLDEPAFCVTTGAATGGAKHMFWPAERPATTVCADPRIGSPQHHTGSQNAGAVAYEHASADKPVALTQEQGCTLMAYPPGTHEHLQGSKADRWRIVGNGVCPPVARAVLETLL
jgi:DNA (cytosine-5)-methyltransferase 1